MMLDRTSTEKRRGTSCPATRSGTRLAVTELLIEA